MTKIEKLVNLIDCIIYYERFSIEELEKIVCDIEKFPRLEWNNVTSEYLTDSTLVEQLMYLAEKFNNNDKIVSEVS